MTSFVADTNLFLRFLLKDIPKQYEQAKEIFIKAKAGKIELIVPQIVIFEIIFSLEKYYGFTKDKIVDEILVIISSKELKIDDREIFQKALVLFKNQKVSFVDCFLASYAVMTQREVLSFDQDFKKLQLQKD